MRLLQFIRKAGIAVAFLGCADPSGPFVTDTLVLRSIDGDPIPAVFREGDSFRMRLLADTPFLADNGTGREAGVP